MLEKGSAMKVTIEMDMTPQEARAFMGLPDVAPIQKKMLEEMQDRMRAAFDAGGIERDANRAAARAQNATTLRSRSTALLVEENARKSASLCADAAVRFAREALSSLRTSP